MKAPTPERDAIRNTLDDNAAWRGGTGRPLAKPAIDLRWLALLLLLTSLGWACAADMTVEEPAADGTEEASLAEEEGSGSMDDATEPDPELLQAGPTCRFERRYAGCCAQNRKRFDVYKHCGWGWFYDHSECSGACPL